jgi:putative ABC transport system substrate-binding protein
MRRRNFITVLGGAAAWPLMVRAQIPTIGVLTIGSPDSRIDAFKEGLRDVGYLEGKNIAVVWRFAMDQERMGGFAAELVGLAPQVVVATSSVPARAIHEATTTIPVVFVAVSDPVEQGFIATLARPGGNMTGLSNTNVELSGKRLEILRDVLPKIRRVAVLINPGNPVSGAALHELVGPAQRLGIVLEPIEARNAFELGVALAMATGQRIDALFVGPDPLFLQQARQLGEFTTRRRLPTMHTNRELVEAGGFVSYGPSLSAMYRRAATYVDKILKGAKAADLPVEQPTKFELVINLKAAKALGLEIPPTVLARTDEVIE